MEILDMDFPEWMIWIGVIVISVVSAVVINAIVRSI